MPRSVLGLLRSGFARLQPEALIGASRTCCPRARSASSSTCRSTSCATLRSTPKDEIHNQQLLEAYPRIRELAVRGSENPNLMPKGAITVRMHSVGGWGAITTGKNLAVTLFELLGYDIKANPKYGSEKKGQPTTYYLSAAPEPIRINCEYTYVDVVLSPDPNVFGHSNPLSGLEEGRRVHHPERAWRRRRRCGQSFPHAGAEVHRRQRHSRLLPRRLQDRARGGDQRRTAAAHAGHRLPGRILRRLAGDAAAPTSARKSCSRPSRTSSTTSSAARASAWWRTTCAWCGAASTELREITEKPVGAARQRSAKRKDAGLPIMLKRMPDGDGRIARHSSLLGTDRQLLCHRRGQRQPGRSVHRLWR